MADIWAIWPPSSLFFFYVNTVFTVFICETEWYLFISSAVIFFSDSNVIQSSEEKYSFSCFLVLRRWSAILKACLSDTLSEYNRIFLLSWLFNFYFLIYNYYFDLHFLEIHHYWFVHSVEPKISQKLNMSRSVRWVKEYFMSLMLNVQFLLCFILKRFCQAVSVSLWHCRSSLGDS